jgi:hypothetical protein
MPVIASIVICPGMIMAHAGERTDDAARQYDTGYQNGIAGSRETCDHLSMSC